MHVTSHLVFSLCDTTLLMPQNTLMNSKTKPFHSWHLADVEFFLETATVSKLHT